MGLTTNKAVEMINPMQKHFLMPPTVVRPTLPFYKRLHLTASVTQQKHLLNTPVPAQQDSGVMCLYEGCNKGMNRKNPGGFSGILAKGENVNEKNKKKEKW